MNIDDYLNELVGTPKQEKKQEKLQEEKPQIVQDESFGPILKTLPARSRNIVCGICRKKLTPGEKYWCQTAETACYWWCTKCLT
jgi:hypothetical protein